MKKLIHAMGRRYIQHILFSEYAHQSFTHLNERSVEYRFALQHLAGRQIRTVLDVGSGKTAWPRLLRDCGYIVTAIDNVTSYWPRGMLNRHWLVLNEDITRPVVLKDKKFDAITCISVLEHIYDYQKAVSNMYDLLNENGLLILTCPFNYNNFDPNVYKRPDALYGQELPYKCSSYSRDQLMEWQGRGRLIACEYWMMFSGPVWACGQRTEWRQVTEAEPHQLGCFAFEKNSVAS